MNTKFKSQVGTNFTQVKHLLKAGLNPDTADLYYHKDKLCIGPYSKIKAEYPYDTSIIPAWSLHRLIEIYSKGLTTSNMQLTKITYNELIRRIDLRIKKNSLCSSYVSAQI